MAARRGAQPRPLPPSRPSPLPAVSAPVGPAVTAAAVGARGLQLGRCSGSGRRSHRTRTGLRPVERAHVGGVCKMKAQVLVFYCQGRGKGWPRAP